MPQNRYACQVDIPGDGVLEINAITWTDTRGRRAIIETRRETKRHGIGAKGTVRVQQNGSVRWKILYQCVVQKDGRLSKRGVEL